MISMERLRDGGSGGQFADLGIAAGHGKSAVTQIRSATPKTLCLMLATVYSLVMSSVT